jgi:hypothetical protein
MTGSHRAVEPTKVRITVAGALTAGALLLAPIGAAVAVPGVAHAAPPGGGPGGTCAPGKLPWSCHRGTTAPTGNNRIIRPPDSKPPTMPTSRHAPCGGTTTGTDGGTTGSEDDPGDPGNSGETA